MSNIDKVMTNVTAERRPPDIGITYEGRFTDERFVNLDGKFVVESTITDANIMSLKAVAL